MKKNKILVNSFIVIVTVITAITILFQDFSLGKLSKLKGDISSSATASTYYDWSELSAIDNDFSYSTIFLTEQTDFYVNTTSSVSENDQYAPQLRYSTNQLDGDRPAPYIKLFNPGDEATIIITNCGIDKEGKMFSVAFHVRVDKMWGEQSTGRNAILRLSRIVKNNYGQLKPYIGVSTDPAFRTYYRTENNTPISLFLDTKNAQVEASLVYFYADTLNVTLNNSKTVTTPLDDTVVPGKSIKYANTATGVRDTSITKINTFYWDLDISTPENAVHSYDYDYFGGNEGVFPLNGKSKIYYNKVKDNNTYTFYSTTDHADTTAEYKMLQGNNGVFIGKNEFIDRRENDDLTTNPNSKNHNLSEIWYGTSAEFLTENVEGEFRFSYGSRSCGTNFLFFSPKGYTINPPIKKVSKTAVEPGETFYYEISQYIPNNYYSNIVDFSEIYSNYSSNNYISKLNFYDKIDDELTVDTTNITLTDINGNDLTDYYTIAAANNVVTTTEKDTAADFYQTAAPYNNLITLKIPVKYNGSVTTTKTIPNTGKTTTKISTGTDNVQNTNEVNVTLTPIKLTYDCVTNGGQATFDNTEVVKDRGATVDLDITKVSEICKKTGNKFLGWAETPTGDVVKNITMPNTNKTVYGIYEPVECTLDISSKVYKIDTEKKTISVLDGVSNEEILKNITSVAELSIDGDKLLVKCDDKTETYTITRYWMPQTGNKVIKYSLIIGITLIAIVALIIINRKKKD